MLLVFSVFWKISEWKLIVIILYSFSYLQIEAEADRLTLFILGLFTASLKFDTNISHCKEVVTSLISLDRP